MTLLVPSYGSLSEHQWRDFPETCYRVTVIIVWHQRSGSPIPSQVADKLGGKKYSSFDALRHAVWKASSATPELRGQFKKQNKGNIDKGKSPFPRESEHAGGRIRYEMHHVIPVSKGGPLYDVDNIRGRTAKRHTEIHKEGK